MPLLSCFFNFHLNFRLVTNAPTTENAHWARYKRIKYLKPFSEVWRGFSRHNCRHVLWTNTQKKIVYIVNSLQFILVELEKRLVCCQAGPCDASRIQRPTNNKNKFNKTNKTEYFILSKIHLHYFNLVAIQFDTN